MEMSGGDRPLPPRSSPEWDCQIYRKSRWVCISNYTDNIGDIFITKILLFI